MFKRKKKKTGSNVPLQDTLPPIPPIKTVKEKENKAMYGLNLSIPFEVLDAYIHERIDKNYGDLTFVPVNVEINDIDLSIGIKFLSVSSVPKENNQNEN